MCDESGRKEELTCPLCKHTMRVEDAPYGDGLMLPTGSCNYCGMGETVHTLEDGEARERAANHRLRELAGDVARGQLAIATINRLPVETHKILRHVVVNDIPPVVDVPMNKPTPPLGKKEIAALMVALETAGIGIRI